MIVVRIEGGLGNQLFQIAFGMQLAEQHRTELVLDLSSYASRPAHDYMLDRFCISYRTLQSDEQRRLPRRYQREGTSGQHAAWWQRAAGWSWHGDALKRVRERPFGFHRKHLRAPDDSYLVGYWQSEQFFPDVRAQVREQFRPCAALSAQSQRVYDQMRSTSSIAIHVRRGDYISDRKAAAIYQHLSTDYYQDSVLSLLQRQSGAEVYVFSNDIAWCRKVLSFPCPVHYVDHNLASHAYEDLWLMTAAQSLVIANSTFSWWGAWLDERESKQVIAPRHWFRPGTLSESGLLSTSWEVRSDARSTCLVA